MVKIPIIQGDFSIASPPNGELKTKQGYIMGRFGIHRESLFCDEEEMEFVAYNVTHLDTAWSVATVDDFAEAKELAKLLNQNKDWDIVKCSANKIENMPESCRLQVQDFKRSCGYYPGNDTDKNGSDK